MPIPPTSPVTRRLLLASLALLPLTVVACGRGVAAPAAPNRGTTTAATLPTTTTTAAETTTLPPPVSTDGPPVTDPGGRGERSRRWGGDPTPAGTVRLHDDGLGTVAFGTSESDAVDSLTNQLGDPRRSRTRSSSCGNRVIAEWEDKGLTAYFSKGKFEGWELSRRGSATTDEGISVGSTIGRVQAAYGDRFEWLHDDNLDNEFAIDRHGRRTFIGGVAEGDNDRSRVRRLWAGYTCAAD